MSLNDMRARQLVLKMLNGSVRVSGISTERDAQNTKINLLKQWKKLLAEFQSTDGQPDIEGEKLTVGVSPTAFADTYVFELRPKRQGSIIRPRFYQLIDNVEKIQNEQ
jgi:hypothetical protein